MTDLTSTGGYVVVEIAAGHCPRCACDAMFAVDVETMSMRVGSATTQAWTAQQLRNATVDGDAQPSCCEIATTSSVRSSNARLEVSERR